jgi:hypothetical protein
MSTMKLLVRPLVLAGVAAAAVAVGVGAGRSERPVLFQTQARGYILPATQIISYEDSVGRLDTATGAIYGLRGDLDNASSRSTWELRVPGVKGENSGWLELQRDVMNNPKATFLVDVINGNTWILHLRGNKNGTWDPVEIFD